MLLDIVPIACRKGESFRGTQMSEIEMIEKEDAETVEISDPLVLPCSPIVSVLMLAYNHGPYVTQAIESVMAQVTEFPIELLIGEDCSNDGTRAIVEDYQRRYPHQIRVISGPKNVGMQRNFLRILEHARGTFIAFCEGDDWWIERNKLQKQYEIMTSSPSISMCVHAAKVFNHRKDKFIAARHRGRRARTLRIEELIQNNGGDVMSCTLFLKRDSLLALSGWLLNFPVGDYPIKIWVASQGGCYYMPEPMGAYRTSTGTSWTSISRSAEEAWKIQKQVVEMLLALDRIINLPRASAAFRNQISRSLRDACLYGGREIAKWPDFCDYRRLVRSYDRFLLFFIGRSALASLIIRKSISVYARFTNRVRFLLS
jgi:glycosyltransferase involved in cell wall biosynthesis